MTQSVWVYMVGGGFLGKQIELAKGLDPASSEIGTCSKDWCPTLLRGLVLAACFPEKPGVWQSWDRPSKDLFTI